MTDSGWLDAIEARLRGPWQAALILNAPEDIAALVAAVRERDAALARVEALADAMEHEAPKPQVGGFLADQIRAALAGEGA